MGGDRILREAGNNQRPRLTTRNIDPINTQSGLTTPAPAAPDKRHQPARPATHQHTSRSNWTITARQLGLQEGFKGTFDDTGAGWPVSDVAPMTAVISRATGRPSFCQLVAYAARPTSGGRHHRGRAPVLLLRLHWSRLPALCQYGRPSAADPFFVVDPGERSGGPQAIPGPWADTRVSAFGGGRLVTIIPASSRTSRANMAR